VCETRRLKAGRLHVCIPPPEKVLSTLLEPSWVCLEYEGPREASATGKEQGGEGTAFCALSFACSLDSAGLFTERITDWCFSYPQATLQTFTIQYILRLCQRNADSALLMNEQHLSNGNSTGFPRI
jgi:hypothetical protein